MTENSINNAANSFENEGPALSQDTIDIPEGFEPTSNPVSITEDGEPTADQLEDSGENLVFTEDELAAIAELDSAWYSKSGERYEALLVLEDGTAFGRLGPSPGFPVPSEENNYGAFVGTAPSGGSDESDESDGFAAEAPSQAGSSSTRGFAAPLDASKGILGGGLSDDRRTRVTNTTNLTNYPTRTVGALNNTTNPGRTGCTGTMVGPRHVLTASHCVMSPTGAITTSGWFHPGQTRTTHPNAGGTAVRWSGVFTRDWRTDRDLEYAILFLEDRANVASLGWMGVAWWNSGSGYSGKMTRLLGFPSRSSSDQWRKCDASPFSSNNCGGWLYRDQHSLSTSSFISGNELAFNVDAGAGQSGSSLLTTLSGGSWVTLGTYWGCTIDSDPWDGCFNTNLNQAARFRSSMYNDVYGWISAVSSSYATHPNCN